MKIKEAHITIMVKDMNKSISFYQNLGFGLQNRWADHYAELSGNGMKIGLHPDSGNQFNNGSGNISIGIIADDFEKVRSHFETRGIKFSVREEEGGSFIHFKDPDGTELYIIKPKW